MVLSIFYLACLPRRGFLPGRQVEDEKLGMQMVETLKMSAGNGVALLMLDRELANRQARPALGQENRALSPEPGG